MGVDEDTDRTIESDSLLQLTRIAFCDVHVEVELCACCGVLKMAEALLEHRNENIIKVWSIFKKHSSLL